jgi:hypothetical protein
MHGDLNGNGKKLFCKSDGIVLFKAHCGLFVKQRMNEVQTIAHGRTNGAIVLACLLIAACLPGCSCHQFVCML